MKKLKAPVVVNALINRTVFKWIFPRKIHTIAVWISLQFPNTTIWFLHQI